MDQEFMDEIDRDLLENGPGEKPHIRLVKAEQSVRELTATNRQLEAELAEARAMGDRYQKADDAAVQILEKAKLTLEVPAAEYVPAISDAWQLIENALEKIR
jgi:hypothetical protein